MVAEERRGIVAKAISEEEILQIEDLFKQNYNTVEIGKIIGRHQSTVERRLKKMGYAMTYGRRVNDFQLKEIINLYKSGMTCKEIYNRYSDLYSCEESIQRIIRKEGVSRGAYKKEVIVNHDYFENIDCERKAYWLGFITADGCVRRKRNGLGSYVLAIQIKNEDRKLLERFTKDIESDREVLDYKYGKKHDCVINIYSKKIYDDLSKYGVVERKTKLISKLPNIDKKFKRDFIRGYFDGDGCITLRKPKDQNIHRATALFCGTEKFLKDLRQNLSEAIDLPENKLIDMNKYGSDVFNLRYTRNQDIYDIYKYMYSDAKLFLDRKKSKFEHFINERK